MYNRWIEKGMLETLSSLGIGCIAFSPLAQGLLTNRYLEGIPEGSRAAKAHGFLKSDDITQDKISRSKRLNVIAQERGQSLAQMALAWILRHPVMTSVLIGASSLNQLEENAAVIENLSFTENELARIEEILT